MAFQATSDQYMIIDKRMSEIKRQLGMTSGCPFDPAVVAELLQGIINGELGRPSLDLTPDSPLKDLIPHLGKIRGPNVVKQLLEHDFKQRPLLTLADFARLSFDDLLDVRNISATTVRRLRSILSEVGVELAEA